MLTHYFAAPGVKMQFVKDHRRAMDYITDAVCEFLQVHRALLMKRTRKRPIVEARQICMYHIKVHTKLSLREIGEYYGDRDHTTVIHALQTVRDLMHTDPEYRAKVIAIGKLF